MDTTYLALVRLEQMFDHPKTPGLSYFPVKYLEEIKRHHQRFRENVSETTTIHR
jgi:hypothetical protein